MNRRQMLAGVAFGAVATGSSFATAWAGEGEDARLAALLERHARSLAELGGSASDPVGDRSLAGRSDAHAANAKRIIELQSISRDQLSPAARLDRDTAAFIYSVLDDQLARPGTIDLDLRPSPYVVSQMNGAYYWLPQRLGGRAATVAPEVYLDSIDALARGIDQESERIAYDAGKGTIAPNFVVATTLAQVRGLRDSKPDANPLLSPALTQGELGEQASERFNRLVIPALERQAAALEALLPQTKDTAGVWAQPDGEANYASSLRANTTSNIAPGELHRMGLEWVRELSEALDRDLRAVGLSKGSVGERIAALNVDSRFIQPDTDAGRAEVMRQAEAYLAAARARVDRSLRRMIDDPVEVRRMPLTTEASSPVAFYNSGGGQGSGGVLLNLRAPSDLPSWRLPTLIHHEGVPGHHTQDSVLRDAGGLSAFRLTARFSAWTEGWALYAEHVADEIGSYADDPFGRIGYLQAQLWRAGRVVVDTGLHHERWSRDQGVAYMVDVVGELPGPTSREVDRYTVYPGQACCFMVGKQQLVTSREVARIRMGTRFSLGDYNDLILRSGPLPMEVLDAMVQQWSAS